MIIGGYGDDHMRYEDDEAEGDKGASATDCVPNQGADPPSRNWFGRATEISAEEEMKCNHI